MSDQYTELLQTVNFQNPTWDAFIFFIWIIVAIVYSFSAGRGRIISLLVATYMAQLVVLQAPFLSSAVQGKFELGAALAQLFTFLGLFVFLFVALSKFVFRTSLEGSGFSSWLFNLIFGLLQIGFLISVILSFLPLEIKDNFAPLVKFVFLDNPAPFVWLVAPMVFLVFFGRHISDFSRSNSN